MRLGILTSGGDCPGLNAAVRAVVRHADLAHGFEVLGIEDGGRGLIERRAVRLTARELDVGGFEPWLSTGGSFLGSLNKEITGADDEVLAGYRDLGVDALIAIGGDGSFAILHDHAVKGGWKMVGIPKTIDDDVPLTDRSIGFDSAVHTVVQAIQYLRTTGVSHDRVMVLETMGRNAGHLALHGGIAGGADAILIPEVPYDVDGLVEAIRRRCAWRAQTFAVVVVAEGIAPPDTGDRSGDPCAGYGGRGESIAAAISDAMGGAIETRAMVLGHLQRGGPPSPLDAVLATVCGTAAVELAAAGRFGQMVALRGVDTVAVPLAEVVAAGQRLVDPHGSLVGVARAMGTYVGEV